ncbi:glycoside hydrolase family 32 protein [Bacillus sp. NEAU-CP5]|uniref:glycoside hydrolase family 32 protein n=1 Tax=Bacillus TaxID=1386 RepID=UPI001C8CB575|nr:MULTISPECIES: glycoside hydrolase family 32 protein [Bacillus]MCX3305910.1 glycoside hydrolase family 32 protein [Bacillus velezensis]MCX8440510.1 glycoside hydrolase family 32 protein [Bacillus sp. NEAU-CP5]ULH20692.1 glycoside hydrolase family 32 protein [Bacillus velezensis]WJF82109.1 glycoside hydrolase family 32 protein [Bacillus velezensis]
MDRIQQAEEALKEAEGKVKQRYRLGYHIMPRANWINDPNGLIQFKGEYHVFFQHHPYDEHWGPMHWGHVKSKDLIHWEHLPVALAPGDAFDQSGCFSGSAVDDHGRLALIYTGHNIIDQEKDLFYQTQNIAVSQDGTVFEKLQGNPVIAEPPEDSARHFRDPKVWKHRDVWYMVIGNSSKENVGRVVLYRSPDLRDWEYAGVLAQSDGNLGYMWECPDFFELGGKHVLLISPQGIEADGDSYQNLHQTGYLIGDYHDETNKFTHGAFKELDHGHDFYAVQTLLDDKGRRIAIGWMDMWESEMPTKADGWCGALTLPRELTLRDDHKLLMNPVEETKQLRKIEYRECAGRSLSGSYLAKTSEDLLEVRAVFDVNDSDAETAGFKIRGLDEEELVLTYNLTDKKLTLDCTKMGKAKDGVRRVQTDTNGKLALRIFIDRSSIEVFANHGETTMTSRIYPNEGRLGIELFSEKGAVKVEEFTYWTLKDIWKRS